MRRLHDLDVKDREILALLEADGRRPNSEIARLTALSAPTVAERIARLRDIGVIRGFTVDIDPARIGLPIAAIIEFQPRSNDDFAAVTAVSRHPSVECSYRVTGPTLLMLFVRVADNAALKNLLEEFTHFGDTKTAVILSAESENRFYFADPADRPLP
ncbi:MAG: Lrp/AsnC family transcriptional regulator [Sphingomicrobium sp.]